MSRLSRHARPQNTGVNIGTRGLRVLVHQGGRRGNTEATTCSHIFPLHTCCGSNIIFPWSSSHTHPRCLPAFLPPLSSTPADLLPAAFPSSGTHTYPHHATQTRTHTYKYTQTTRHVHALTCRHLHKHTYTQKTQISIKIML